MPWCSSFALCRSRDDHVHVMNKYMYMMPTNNSATSATATSHVQQHNVNHPPTNELYKLILQLHILRRRMKSKSQHNKLNSMNCARCRKVIDMIRKQCYIYPNDVKYVNPETGQTPLCLALSTIMLHNSSTTNACSNYSKSTTQIIAMMLELYPAALYIQDAHGRTPLHYVVIREPCCAPCYSILQLICTRLSLCGTSAATASVEHEFLLSDMLDLPRDVMKLVLSFIPNPGLMKDHVNGSTPLSLACSSSSDCSSSNSSNKVFVLEKLLYVAPGACSIPDSCGYIPLHYTCRVNCYLSTRVIGPLICAAPNSPTIPDKNGNLPLHHICNAPFQHDVSCFLEAVCMLIESYPGAASLVNKDGKTPLHYACHTSLSVRVVWEIWRANPDSLFNEDGHGMTPLQYARSPHKFSNAMMNHRILQMLFRIRGDEIQSLR